MEYNIMGNMVYKDKEIEIFYVKSEIKDYNHKGIPYSNSLIAWEDEYHIEFNNDVYYIKLEIHYSFIHNNMQFSLFYKKNNTIAYCSNRYIIRHSFGRMKLTDISGGLRNQQYKMIKQRTNMPNEGEMIELDKKMNKKITHLEDFFQKEFCKKFGL